MIFIRIITGKWSVTKMTNGSLAGLVAICACADEIEFYNALLTGIIAGAVYEMGSRGLLMLHMDDPVGINLSKLNIRRNPGSFGWRYLGNHRLWTLPHARYLVLWRNHSFLWNSSLGSFCHLPLVFDHYCCPLYLSDAAV